MTQQARQSVRPVCVTTLLHTLGEIAVDFEVSPATVRRWIAQGAPIAWCGRRRIALREELVQWLRRPGGDACQPVSDASPDVT